MKNLILASLALLPASAFADTNVTCDDGNVAFHLISGRGGVANEGAILTVVANGVLHTVIDSRVDKVDATQAGKVVLNLTTLNADGLEDKTSGKAILTLDVVPGAREGEESTSAGTATLVLTKNPPLHPRKIRFQPKYELVNCKGTI